MIWSIARKHRKVAERMSQWYFERLEERFKLSSNWSSATLSFPSKSFRIWAWELKGWKLELLCCQGKLEGALAVSCWYLVVRKSNSRNDPGQLLNSAPNPLKWRIQPILHNFLKGHSVNSALVLSSDSSSMPTKLEQSESAVYRSAICHPTNMFSQAPYSIVENTYFWTKVLINCILITERAL